MHNLKINEKSEKKVKQKKMAIACKKCKKKYVSAVSCASCRETFHATCEIMDSEDPDLCLKDEFMKLKDVRGVKWFCPPCEEKFGMNNETVKSLSQTLRTLSESYEVLSKQMSEITMEKSVSPSYANVVKRIPAQIIVKPKDANSVPADRDKARELIINAVNPDDAKIKSMSNCANNGLRISMLGDKMN